ncbi:MAG: hypothetical protein NUV77_04505 [Thermoguttaceae bacterium]|jgi:hypothetical protein|nr:hypothetical protein [Thermoguttaceae bacterium]
MDTAPVNAEAVSLQPAVRERLMAGFYARGAAMFDPRLEISGVQIHELRKAGVAALLFGTGGAARPDSLPDRDGLGERPS